ncbi:MAG: hypothetical protein H0V89_09895, partial [Deltaproteobacteria bacterium]|nr:hypothetical protein [Deltaproteobacteria bacterium]
MSGRLVGWIDGVVLVAAGALLAALASLWGARLGYPFDLEWMEGGMLAHAWRIRHGLPLYGPPDADFVPFIYPPGFSWLLAAIGPGYAAGRAISLLGTLAAAGAAAFAVHRVTGDRVPAVWAAAVFLGTWDAGGAFFDLARPDGAMLGLLGWSIALALVPGARAAAASGLLLTLAFLFKHNAA